MQHFIIIWFTVAFVNNQNESRAAASFYISRDAFLFC